jgi:hypothetical protein
VLCVQQRTSIIKKEHILYQNGLRLTPVAPVTPPPLPPQNGRKPHYSLIQRIPQPLFQNGATVPSPHIRGSSQPPPSRSNQSALATCATSADEPERRWVEEVLSLGTAARSSGAAARTPAAGRGGAEHRGSGAEPGWHETGEVPSLGTTPQSSGATVRTFVTRGGAAGDQRWWAVEDRMLLEAAFYKGDLNSTRY